jgi:ATP-binding cassette subfamily B protein
MHTVYTYFMAKAMRTMQARLRGALVTRLQQLSITFHINFQSGRTQTKLLRDVETIENMSRQLVTVVLRGIIVFVVGVSVTMVKRPLIGMFSLLAVPVSAFLVQAFRRRMDERNREFRTELENMSAMVAEMMEMIPVTRAHAAEETEVRRMKKQFREIRQRGLRLDVLNAVFHASAWATFHLFQLGCLGASAWLAWRGDIRPGDVVLFVGYFGMLVREVNHIAEIYPFLYLGRESVLSVGEILECPDIERNEGKRTVAQVRGDIAFEDVEYRYGPDLEPAVREMSFRIAAGECVAFVGESGSGKSTLMNLAIGFRRPTRGRILLDGADMEGLDMRTYRQFLAMVPQNTVLFSGSIRENITYGLDDVSEFRLQEALETANVTEFLGQLPQGLETRIGEHGGKLSGGQRQRIAIARALIRDPKVLILDEATSSLDVISEHLVQQAVERLIRGRTTLIVAHRLSTIRNAGRIYVLKKGQIIEQGTQAGLLALQGEFHRLRSLQV